MEHFEFMYQSTVLFKLLLVLKEKRIRVAIYIKIIEISQVCILQYTQFVMVWNNECEMYAG